MMFDYIFLNIIRALANSSCFFSGELLGFALCDFMRWEKEGHHDT